MRVITLIYGLLLTIVCFTSSAVERSPLELATLVADKIIEQSDFSLQYVVQPKFPDAEVVDFESLPNVQDDIVAYALTTISSKKDQEETFEIGFAGEVKVWINNVPVFNDKRVQNTLDVIFQEKTYLLPFTFNAKLKSGDNKILIKYIIPRNTKDRKIILQSRNLGRYAIKDSELNCTLKNYAPQVKLTNWLILGPFLDDKESSVSLREQSFNPETEIQLFKVYASNGYTFSWNLPRININAQGSSIVEWNYHVGGFMWGLRLLTDFTKNQKYAEFSNKWCDTMLDTKSLVNYQTKILNAVRSTNWSLVGRPMLDYTTAPAMPFLVRLNEEEEFTNRNDYEVFVNEIIDYALNKQYRIGKNIFGRNFTLEPSVWADDMFMGIPFLLHSTNYIKNKELKNRIYDEVANQVVNFSALLLDEKTGLYRQACFVNNPKINAPLWSRGNGWVVWTLTEVLNYLPESHHCYKTILKIYKDQIQSLVKFQNDSGYWHNLVDDTQTVKESSGTAIFTYAIAKGINKGWLPKKIYKPYVDKGWLALQSFINSDGIMDGVKGGTNFSSNPEDYEKTPIIKNDTHGVFPFLFTCIEIYNLQENEKKKK